MVTKGGDKRWWFFKALIEDERLCRQRAEMFEQGMGWKRVDASFGRNLFLDVPGPTSELTSELTFTLEVKGQRVNRTLWAVQRRPA